MWCVCVFFFLSYSLAFFVPLHWQHHCGGLICVLLPHVCSIHLVFIKLAFGRNALSLAHQTTDTSTTWAAAVSASSGIYFGLTDGRSQLETVFLSPPFPLLVHINSFRLKQSISSVRAQGYMMCWICIRCLAGVERERVGGVVGGRGWGSPHWLMTESGRAPHSPFPPPTSPLERGEIYPEPQLQNPKPHPVVFPMSHPNPPPSCEIQITQLRFCFRSLFFFSSLVPEMESLHLSVTAAAGFWCL